MTMLRQLIVWAMPITGGLWLADTFELISLPPGVSHYLWAAFMLVWGIDIVMDWRSRKSTPYAEPSPARSAVGVIIATGAVAVLATVENARSASDYIVPASIVIATAILSIAAFRFAAKNRGSIGEARFDTMKDG